MARGNRREDIFLDDNDRGFFLQAVSEACAQTGWLAHAWVLMSNHYHLCIETPEANLVEGMKWLQNTYTRRFNVRHRAWGRCLATGYKAVVVEGELPEYYGSLVDYIHLNPVRAGVVSGERGESVLDYPWSSLAGGYGLAPGKRPKWLAAEVGMERLGYVDTAGGRRRMVEELDRRALSEGRQSGLVPLPEEVDARMSHLRRGWYWGSQEFAEKLRGMLGQKMDAPRSRAYPAHPAEAVARVRAGAKMGRAGIEGGGAGTAGSQGLAWERREEGGVGEVPQGTDHGLLRVGGTGAVHGRGGERGALRANAAVEKCEEENPEGNVAVHRAGS